MHAAQGDVERFVRGFGGGCHDGCSPRGLQHLARRDRRRSSYEENVRGDALVDRSADRLRGLSESAARRGGVARKLARPLAEDAVFVRKLKPSLIRARARGAAPTGGAPHDVVPPLPAEENKSGSDGGPNPFAVIGGAAATGFVLAKVVDWRGHAHPRS
jgi:hypothetical protein